MIHKEGAAAMRFYEELKWLTEHWMNVKEMLTNEEHNV
jgi:hypothetical protein